MFTTNYPDYRTRQAELIQEADRYRLIQSLEKAPSPTLRGIIQGWITFLLLP